MYATAPAWLPDPSTRHQLRWWDGHSWTPHVADGATVAVDPVRPPDSGASLGDAPTLKVRRLATPRSAPGRIDVLDPAGGVLAHLLQVPLEPTEETAAFGASAGGPRFELHLADGTRLGSLVRPPERSGAPTAGPRLAFTDPSGDLVGEVVATSPDSGPVQVDVRSAADGMAVGAVLRRYDITGRRWSLIDDEEEVIASVSRSFYAPPQAGSYAPVEYQLSFVPPMTHPIRLLAVAAVVCLDLSCSQAPEDC